MEQIMNFRPKRPYLFLGIILLLLICSIFIYSSNYLDDKMFLGGMYLIFILLIVFFVTDFAYISLKYENNNIIIRGFFKIRRIKFHISEIQGYEIHEKLDQTYGYKEVLVLVARNKKIVLSKVLYSNFDEMENWVKSNFQFLGYNRMKYKQFMSKSFVIMSIISSILFFLLAIAKMKHLIQIFN